MSAAEKLSDLKTILGDDASLATDEQLLACLSSAEEAILRKAYPFDSSVTEVPSIYEKLLCDIAVYLFNKRGAEGEISHNENGINRTYESADVPDSVLKRVVPKVGTL